MSNQWFVYSNMGMLQQNKIISPGLLDAVGCIQQYKKIFHIKLGLWVLLGCSLLVLLYFFPSRSFSGENIKCFIHFILNISLTFWLIILIVSSSLFVILRTMSQTLVILFGELLIPFQKYGESVSINSLVSGTALTPVL